MLLLVLVLTGLSAWGSSNIKIFTARNAIFPKYIDVYQRLESFLQKFGAVSELVVVVEDAPQAQLKEFATELASRLRQKPEIRHAIERFDTLFMLTHGYLLLPPAQLSRFTSVLQGLAGVHISTGLTRLNVLADSPAIYPPFPGFRPNELALWIYSNRQAFATLR